MARDEPDRYHICAVGKARANDLVKADYEPCRSSRTPLERVEPASARGAERGERSRALGARGPDSRSEFRELLLDFACLVAVRCHLEATQQIGEEGNTTVERPIDPEGC